MNLPNQLTLARLVLTALFVAVLSLNLPHTRTAALLLFATAAFTDYLDGYLARKHNLITNFGKLMDPLADKVLMAAGFIMLVQIGLIPGWVVVAILTREFLVTGLRLVAAADGKVLAAENLGKHKTVWQIATLLYFLFLLASREPAFQWMAPLFTWSPTGPPVLGRLLITASLVLTVWSGLNYLFKNLEVLSED